MIGGGAEERWSHWSKVKTEEKASVSNDEVLKAIMSNDMSAVGEVLFDCGRGKNAMIDEVVEKEREVSEKSITQLENKEATSACVKRETKSEQYIAARKSRNERRREKRKRMRKSSCLKLGSMPISVCSAACDVIDTCDFDESMPDYKKMLQQGRRVIGR
jgi:hypothetical protein